MATDSRFRADRGGPRTPLPWLLWSAIFIAVTGALVILRGPEDQAQTHAILVILLVVLGGSVSGGRALGLTLAIASFLVIDYFFETPRDRLTVSKELDWVVLAAYMAAAYVATELVALARDEADDARAAAREIERLANERVRLIEAAEHAEVLRQAAQMKDALLASVSHDLRTPLTAIKALAHELAATGSATARTIEIEADRLTHLVSSLLDYSRIEGGALPVSAEVNTAEDVIGAVARQVVAVIGAHPFHRRVDVEGPVLAGRFDFLHTMRTLTNLVENAAKYSPPTAPIELSAVREGTVLAFAVADRGPGIPGDEGERIFDPFYRRADVPPDVGGVGLGLAIARRLTVAQGGTLTYAARDGGGSIFTLRLPAAELGAPSSPAPALAR